MILYRPIGLAELRLIAEAGFKRFPPRLDWQPIFYPVLEEIYAIEIARDWNTKDQNSGFLGFVTRFTIDDSFVQRYPVQTVGLKHHRELWVPAEDLESFNQHIIGVIEVISHFQGEQAKTRIDPLTHLPMSNGL